MVLLIGMSLDLLKQAQKVIFSRKRNKTHHPDIIVNRNLVKKALTKNVWECFVIRNLQMVDLLVLFVSSEILDPDHRDHLFYKSIRLV